MKAVLVGTLILVLTLSWESAKAQDDWIQTVCDRLRKVDTKLVNHIQSLPTTDREDFLNDMREYLQAVRSFQSCLEQDKESTVTMAKDILEEEGPKFYYHYDAEYIQNTLNFSESEMSECNQLQKQAVEVWQEIDKKLSDGDGNGE